MSRYRDDDRNERYSGRNRQGGYGERYEGAQGGSDRGAERDDWRERDFRGDRDREYDANRGMNRDDDRNYGRERYYSESPRGDYANRDYEDRRYDERGRARSANVGGGETRGGASRSHLRCRDIMTRDVTVATREATLADVAAMMRDEDTGVIPVVERDGATIDAARSSAANSSAAAAGVGSTATPSTATITAGPGVGSVQTTQASNDRTSASPSRIRGNGRLVGLITDRDIVIRAIAAGKDPRNTRAEEIMTDDVHTAQANDRVIDVIKQMGDKQVRRIPVVDNDGNLTGIISMADVALETEEDRELAAALEEISSGSSFWSKIFG